MGELLYNSIAGINLPQVAFSGARLVYLFFLQTLTTSNVPVTQPVYPLPPFLTQAVPMNTLLDGLSYFPYGYLVAEFGYEFFRGARLSPDD